MDNKHNKFFPSFSFFNEEFKSGNYIINLFPECFSFYSCYSNVKKHLKNLDEIIFKVSSDPSSVIVVLDISIKNHVIISILHIHSFNKPIVKTLYRTINVTIAEAELFAIWCGINQAVAISNISYIIVITNSLYVTKKIFDSSAHLYQIHLAAISQELREYFFKDDHNLIKFWNCPSKQQ